MRSGEVIAQVRNFHCMIPNNQNSQMNSGLSFRILSVDLDKLEMEKNKKGFKRIMKKPYKHIVYDRFPTTHTALRIKHDVMSYARNPAIGYIYRIVKLNK